ncbi:hypothetical protein [Nostoc sp. CCY0012]|uniref:hypothetical protein n=1 Tax=Nostoc sp. CCY0012 TaxID=1056123 RepID=UPI0039C63DCF
MLSLKYSLLYHQKLEAALQVADKVAVFYAGTTLEVANTVDFTTGNLRHPYTQALWRSLRNCYSNSFSTWPSFVLLLAQHFLASDYFFGTEIFNAILTRAKS